MKLLFNYNEFLECLKQARIWNRAGIYNHRSDHEILTSILKDVRDSLDIDSETSYIGVGNLQVILENLADDKYILNFGVTPLVYTKPLHMSQQFKNAPITLGW